MFLMKSKRESHVDGPFVWNDIPRIPLDLFLQSPRVLLTQQQQ